MNKIFSISFLTVLISIFFSCEKINNCVSAPSIQTGICIDSNLVNDSIVCLEKDLENFHDHLILDDGEVVEFCDPRIQNIRKTVEEIYNVEISDHKLYFYGKKKQQ